MRPAKTCAGQNCPFEDLVELTADQFHTVRVSVIARTAVEDVMTATTFESNRPLAQINVIVAAVSEKMVEGPAAFENIGSASAVDVILAFVTADDVCAGRARGGVNARKRSVVQRPITSPVAEFQINRAAPPGPMQSTRSWACPTPVNLVAVAEDVEGLRADDYAAQLASPLARKGIPPSPFPDFCVLTMVK